jgi:hypothetical protein
MQTRFYVFSRIRDKETREQLELDDSWDQYVTFDNMNQACAEFDWLSSHGNMREYKLFVVRPRLDDNLPWND